MEEYKDRKLILIDGHSIINRAFYGMPDLTNSKGVHTGAVYGFLNIMFRILEEEKADYLIVAFDEAAPTFRHEMFREYKGTRKPMPEELRSQVPLLREVLKAMGITICSQPGLEADDILGTYAKRAESEGMLVSLVSGDRDLLQIATDRILIRIPKTIKGQTTIENYHTEDVKERYNITPHQVIEIKGLMGDTADNIPGVPKVGEKTAHQLIDAYGSVDGVYAHLDEITKKALHENLANNRELAYLSLQLAAIRTDCDLPFEWDKARIGNFYTKEAYTIFTELNFRNFLTRFDDTTAADATRRDAEEADASSGQITVIRDRSAAEDAFAIIKGVLRHGTKEEPGTIGLYPVYVNTVLTEDTLPDTAHYEQGSLFDFIGDASGENEDDKKPCEEKNPAAEEKEEEPSVKHTLYMAAISVPGGNYLFIPDAQSAAENKKETVTGAKDTDACGFDRSYLTAKMGQLRTLARDKGGIVSVFDIKNLYPYLAVQKGEFDDSGICLTGMLDTLLGCYLCNPVKNDYTVEDCVGEYTDLVPQSYLQLFGKKSIGDAVAEDEDKLVRYAAQMAEGIRLAAVKIRMRLIREDMWELYKTIELPLSYILYDMQRIGIITIRSRLNDYSRELGRKAEKLEASIYAVTGEKFNISSPKQLGEMLFEKMKIPGGKKTKTGWSTAADVLEKLAVDYPIVQEILDYRAVTKLKSTYADGLTAFIAPDGRIHTVFNQTITATGRISSSDPNLQNIPMRTEMGRLIRKAFLPRKNYIFTDADYSQIELRILASMSGDEELIEAYRQNKDIHRITASKVFHIPFEEVTALERRNAKAVNFGIVYGISAFGLSQDINISRKEAQEYIDSYFRTYPGIKNYLDNSVADAKERGYSLTLYNRRRPIPELKDSNFMKRQFGERVAMNAPIQGTAADIMKIAMIRVYERLHREHLESRLILQIHDELLIETAPGEENEVAAILAEEMKAAADLPVSLEAEVHTGTDWYEAK